MHAEISTATARRAPVGLVWLAGTAAFGIGASAVYAATGLGFPCPFRTITGWDCPLCGGTRMGTALLHGDPVQAFWFNPMAFVGLVVATLVGGWLVIELVTGRRGLLAARMRAIARTSSVTITPATVMIAAGILLAAWTVARNLILGPLP